jgi:hypothetical protein
MLKSLLLAGLATILTTLPGLAENWVRVTRDQSGTDYYIDAESVQGSNVTYLFWYMSVNPKPDEQGIVATKTYISISCPLRGSRRLLTTSFNAQGELVDRKELGDDEPLQIFAEGSVGERLWKFVCK